MVTLVHVLYDSSRSRITTGKAMGRILTDRILNDRKSMGGGAREHTKPVGRTDSMPIEAASKQGAEGVAKGEGHRRQGGKSA